MKVTTVNQLHKKLGKLIEVGYGRAMVVVNKPTFTDNRESDGCTNLPIADCSLTYIYLADDDGGIATNKDGSERGRMMCVLSGCSFDPKAIDAAIAAEGRAT